MKPEAIVNKLLEVDQFDPRAYLLAVRSYWDIHVKWGEDDGYSSFVELPMQVPEGGEDQIYAPDDPEALEVMKLAAEMRLFDLGDARDVDYVRNTTREDYHDATGK